jgi:radical SAM superfamily enzyme YgiQ (UPF0313 family)
MKILLVQPRPESGVGFPNLSTMEPLGLEVVGSSLLDYEVEILDLFSMDDFPQLLHKSSPDVVGISCSFTVDVLRTRKLGQLVKEHMPQVFVFVGGHHATLSPGDFAVPYIDAVVLGEGEVIAPELIRNLEEKGDLSATPGLALYDRHQQKQYLTPIRPLQKQLNSSSSADRSLTSKYRRRYFHGFKRPMATVETSRGCPYRCTFCSVWNFYRNTVRYKSPELAAEEIKNIKERDLMIVDDNFFSKPERALRIAQLLEGKIKKTFIIQARSDTIVKHPDLLDAWKGCGLDGVFIGFEKIDPEALKEVNKNNSIYNNEKALVMIRERGMKVYASFIVDPAFSLLDFKKLGEYIARWNIRFPYFSVLTPLPGTPLYNLRNKELTTKNWELFDFLHPVLPTKLSLEQFYQELAALYRVAYTGSINVKGGLFVFSDFLKTLCKDYRSIEHLSRLYRGAKMMVNPLRYLHARE